MGKQQEEAKTEEVGQTAAEAKDGAVKEDGKEEEKDSAPTGQEGAASSAAKVSDGVGKPNENVKKVEE